MALKPTVQNYFSKDQLGDRAAFVREFRFDRAAIDVEKRTACLSFSSEHPVLRYDMRGQPFYEVLDHESVNMADMRTGAPLLYGHDRRDHLGTVLEATVGADKKGRALVKFSRSKFAEEKFQDVQDGILTKTSVGYDLIDSEPVEDGEREGIPVIRFRNWRPYEATLCPLPADNTVGVGRSHPESKPAVDATPAPAIEVRIKPIITMPEVITPAAPAVAAPVQVADHAAERKRAADILGSAKQLASRHPDKAQAIRDLADTSATDGSTVESFNSRVLQNILASAPAAPVEQRSATLGLNGKDRKRFSLMRAIRMASEGRPLDGLERECSDELAKNLERTPQGFFVPDEVLLGNRIEAKIARERTLLSQSPADGGYTIGEEMIVSEFVELLRNQVAVVGLGARVIPGLRGNVSIPRQLTGAVAYWAAEGNNITQSSATFGQIVMRPRRLGTSVPYSKEFLAQTSLAAEGFIRDDSLNAIAVELDRVTIQGGGGVEPLGILNLATGDRSTSVTFSGAATFAKIVEFETNVAANNALLGSPAYITTPATRGKWRVLQKFTGGGVGVWNTDMDVAGYPGRATNQFPTSPTANQVIFGDFSQVIIGEWAGTDIVVDPYSGKRAGTVEVTIHRMVDSVIRRGKSFAISSDTGAA